MATKLLTTLRL